MPRKEAMRTAGLRLDQAPPLGVPLRFFLTAPLFGVAAGASLAVGGGSLLAHPLVPDTLALVHLVTLGWVTMVMLGALYQILPVLAGAMVPWIGLGRWVHASLAGGAAALAVGLQTGWTWAIACAIPLLAFSLITALVQCSVAAWCVTQTAAVGWAIRLALGALALTAAAGLVFALRQAIGTPLAERGAWIAVHAYWGLAGWIGTLILGVGSVMLPMFYLTPRMPRIALRAALGAVLLAPISATVLPLLGASTLGNWIPAVCAIAAFAALALSWLGMLRKRRRTASDASLWLWRAALVHGAAACGLLAWHQWEPAAGILLALGSAYLVGFAGQIINAMLLKIVPFLVWLHRFSGTVLPVLRASAQNVGKTPVPLMADLLPPRHARRQSALMIGSTALLVLACLLPYDPLARVAGAALTLACGYLEWLLWRAWRTSPSGSDEARVSGASH